MKTQLNYRWKHDGDSLDAFVRRMAYPCATIQEKLDIIKKFPPELRRQLYNPSQHDLQMANVYNIPLPKSV